MTEPSHLPTDQAPLEVRDAPERRRYEATFGDEAGLAAILTYARSGKRLTLIHTEVQPGFEGRGVGGRLARAVFDDARARGLRVVPKCPFIVRWLERHPEQHDLLASAPSAAPPASPDAGSEPA